MVGLIHSEQKGKVLVGYRINYVTLTIDLTHDLDLGFSKLSFEVAVSQELLVWLKWNEKEANQLDTEQTMWPCRLTIPMTLALNFHGEKNKLR